MNDEAEIEREIPTLVFDEDDIDYDEEDPSQEQFGPGGDGVPDSPERVTAHEGGLRRSTREKNLSHKAFESLANSMNSGYFSLCLHTANISIPEALKNKAWRPAIDDEINGLIELDTFDWVDHPGRETRLVHEAYPRRQS